MSPADERVLQLLAKWQTSLELHARYASLPDEQYWLVQPWPRHQRPTRWVIDLARQRTADLRRLVEARISAGDTSLSEALELMGFMTNLVGSQHVERFIPLADPAQARAIESLTIAASAPAPEADRPATEPEHGAEVLSLANLERAVAAPPASLESTAPQSGHRGQTLAATASDSTREMPAIRPATPAKAAARAAAVPAPEPAAPVSASAVPAPRPAVPARAPAVAAPAIATKATPAAARAPTAPARSAASPAQAAPGGSAASQPAETLADSGARRGRAAARQKAKPEARAAEHPAEPAPLPQARQLEVIADAIRLLNWGRDWHELPESIARMAGRPSAAQVRAVLRSHRGAIEKQAGSGRSN